MFLGRVGASVLQCVLKTASVCQNPSVLLHIQYANATSSIGEYMNAHLCAVTVNCHSRCASAARLVRISVLGCIKYDIPLILLCSLIFLRVLATLEPAAVHDCMFLASYSMSDWSW